MKKINNEIISSKTLQVMNKSITDTTVSRALRSYERGIENIKVNRVKINIEERDNMTREELEKRLSKSNKTQPEYIDDLIELEIIYRLYEDRDINSKIKWNKLEDIQIKEYQAIVEIDKIDDITSKIYKIVKNTKYEKEIDNIIKRVRQRYLCTIRYKNRAKGKDKIEIYKKLNIDNINKYLPVENYVDCLIYINKTTNKITTTIDTNTEVIELEEEVKIYEIDRIREIYNKNIVEYRGYTMNIDKYRYQPIEQLDRQRMILYKCKETEDEYLYMNREDIDDNNNKLILYYNKDNRDTRVKKKEIIYLTKYYVYEDKIVVYMNGMKIDIEEETQRRVIEEKMNRIKISI